MGTINHFFQLFLFRERENFFLLLFFIIFLSLCVLLGGHAAFKHIHLLVKVEGLTLEGAAKRLKGDKKEVINKSKVLDSLKAIRAQLSEIREEL